MYGKHLIKIYTRNTKNFQHNYKLNFSVNARFPEREKEGCHFPGKQKFDSKTQDMFDNLQQKYFF